MRRMRRYLLLSSPRRERNKERKKSSPPPSRAESSRNHSLIFIIRLKRRPSHKTRIVIVRLPLSSFCVSPGFAYVPSFVPGSIWGFKEVRVACLLRLSVISDLAKLFYLCCSNIYSTSHCNVLWTWGNEQATMSRQIERNPSRKQVDGDWGKQRRPRLELLSLGPISLSLSSLRSSWKRQISRKL